MSPLNRESYDFLIQFEPYYFHLKESVNFEPIPIIDELVTEMVIGRNYSKDFLENHCYPG